MRAALFACAAAAALAAFASTSAARPLTSFGMRAAGTAVTPRSFTLESLPRLQPGDLATVQVHKPEGLSAQAARDLERQKAHPAGPTIDQLRTVTFDRNTLPPGLVARADLGPLAPTPVNGFEGITQAGFIPGEPTVGAGALNIFSAGNSSVTVTNKDGSNRIETAGTTFFGVLPGEGGISDAQCYYDAIRGRFVALCFTFGTSPNHSFFYLAISKTSDARGAWWQYRFDMSLDGITPSNNWADYQSLGISDDKIALTGQMFTFGGNAYQYQKVRVLDRAAAYAGQPLGYVDFFQFAPPVGGDFYNVFVTKAARNTTPGDNTIHLFCVRTGGGVNVAYRTITGSPQAPTLSAGVLVPVSPYAPPADAHQKGSTLLVPTNDCRPTDFYVRNGVLTCAWHQSVSLGNLVSGIRLFQMRTSDQTVLTDETYVASGLDMYFPAVTVDSAGTVFLGFDRSSATEYPSSYVTGKRRSDAVLQPSALLKAGLAPSLVTRWGDYTGIDLDASLTGPGGASAWYAGQYTKGTSTFGTWIQQVRFTYGEIAGSVFDDCDGSTSTTSDRAPLQGVTLSLVQGATTVATTTTDAGGAFDFGWLESGTYDVIVTPPGGGTAVDAVAGSGVGTTQTRISASDVRVTLTNSQASTGQQFFVTRAHEVPLTTGLAPFGRVAGTGAFTLTVNGANFVRCATVRWDGADRPTTWLNANQLSANIAAADVSAPGTHAVTVFAPAPAGGTSNAQTFTATAGADTQAPVVTLTAPSGGESWAIGSARTITWTASDNVGVPAVDLALSVNGGTSFATPIATGVPNTGTYPWTVAGLPTATARIRVLAHDGGGNLGADSSHANVTLAGWTITATAGANGTVSPAGAAGVGDGATPAYTFAPASGFAVLDVKVDGVSVGAVPAYTFPPVHASHTLAVTFGPATCTLAVNVSGNGTVTRVPDLVAYPVGSSVTLTAAAAPGWAFDRWSGDANATVNPLGLRLDANTTITATFTQHIYTWNPAGTGDWQTASNWTPVRSAPAHDDVLQFTADAAVSNVATDSVGRIALSNGAHVSLTSPLPATITLTGRAGSDLDVPAGCALSINGSSAFTIALNAASTGLVAGTINVSNGAHRLTALTPGSLVFVGGSQLLIGSAFSGNLFGAGSGSSAPNSVVFQNGSLYAQASGNNPFGISVPGTCVIFQAGSRFRIDGNIILSVSGRNYADLEMNYPGTITVNGSTAFGMDSLIVTRGSLQLNLTGGGSIRGNLRVAAGATLGLVPSPSAATYVLAGSAPQVVDVGGTFTTTSLATLNVNNSTGVTLARDWSLAGPVGFTAGRVYTGANTLGVAATGTVTGASPVTGWVAGNLRRNIAAGNSNRVFDVGDGLGYSPITLAMNGVASAFDLTGGASVPEDTTVANSDLDPLKLVHRTWRLDAPAPPAFASYDATFAFPAGDLDAAANSANLVVRRYAGAWSSPTTGVRTATSTQATGLGAFGAFVVGERIVDTATPLVAVTSPNGGETLVGGHHVNLTWTATDNTGVTNVDLLLSRGGLAGPFDTLATARPNTGTYDWLVTIPGSTDARLKVVAHDAYGNSGSDVSDAPFTIDATLGVDDAPVRALALAPVRPNPLSGAATFAFALPREAHVRLSVLDVQGREVLTLAEGAWPAGRHALPWTNGTRGTLGAGLYFARLRVEGRSLTQRFVVTR